MLHAKASSSWKIKIWEVGFVETIEVLQMSEDFVYFVSSVWSSIMESYKFVTCSIT